MKAVRRIAISLCAIVPFLAGVASAQTNAPARAVRQYDSRIQMHAAPVTLQVPDNSLEAQKGAAESIERNLVIPNNVPRDLNLSTDLLPESQPRPAGPRLKNAQDKKQNKNWILPPSSEKKEEGEETQQDQKKDEPAPSGWGWLADDVRARQQKQKEKDAQEESNSEKKDNEFKPPSALPKEEVNPKADGIFLNTAFKPVSASTPTKESKQAGGESASARNESKESQEDRQAGPSTAESPRDRTSADQPREQKFGADATWGNESLWSKDLKTAPSLPQTEALLSMSKLDAGKPNDGLTRPGFKPDAGAGTIARSEPDRLGPPPRSEITATGFQPLPTAPVNDLGASPWGGSLPASAPFAGSTPFSPEPNIAPSRSIEPLKAPELPKPSSPWLK